MHAIISMEQIKERVRKTVSELTEIDQDKLLKDNDDLFFHGMSSRASVALMFGLESEFDIEFPESMLHRENFKSVDCISKAIAEIITNCPQP